MEGKRQTAKDVRKGEKKEETDEIGTYGTRKIGVVAAFEIKDRGGREGGREERGRKEGRREGGRKGGEREGGRREGREMDKRNQKIERTTIIEMMQRRKKKRKVNLLKEIYLSFITPIGFQRG